MKLCDTCIYRNNVEQLKPCIIYRDNCEYYEKERDMTREEVCESCIHWVRMYFDKEDSPNICELSLMGCPYAPKEKQIKESDKE